MSIVLREGRLPSLHLATLPFDGHRFNTPHTVGRSSSSPLLLAMLVSAAHKPFSLVPFVLPALPFLLVYSRINLLMSESNTKPKRYGDCTGKNKVMQLFFKGQTCLKITLQIKSLGLMNTHGIHFHSFLNFFHYGVIFTSHKINHLNS